MVSRMAHTPAGVGNAETNCHCARSDAISPHDGTCDQSEDGMKIGFFAVGIGATAEPDAVRAVAVAAERLGFATLWAPEHVVLVEEYASQYPYSDGRFP